VSRPLVALILASVLVSVGCGAARQSAKVDALNVASPWSREAAEHILHRAVNSDDAALRAEAWRWWIASADSSVTMLLQRAVMDPSPMVQRVLAKHHAQQIGEQLAGRVGVDSLALAWLAQRGVAVPVPPDEPWRTVISALGGSVPDQSTLLAQIEVGLELPEPGLIALLSESDIEGMGAALMVGAEQVEEELADEMRLAALGLGEERAAEALLHPDAASELSAWAIEVAARRPHPPAVARLRHLARAEDHALSMHARLALMALGEGYALAGTEGLVAGDRDTRAWAATCVGMAHLDRPLPRDVIALLQGSTRDESRAVRAQSVRTLVRTSGVEAVLMRPALGGQEPDAVSVFLAAQWLAKLGPEDGR
jgi:hypothetical protein